MPRAPLGLLLAVVPACLPAEGGLTAQLVFSPWDDGQIRQGLRTSALPAGVGRLVIDVLEGEQTLGATALDLMPGPGEALLMPEGGRWRIEGIPAGPDRALRARAFLAAPLGPAETLLFEGRRTGITIIAGQTTNVGIVALDAVGTRNPAFDFSPPAPPQLEVQVLPEGGAVQARWPLGSETDLGGYLVARARSSNVTPALDRSTSPPVGTLLGADIQVVARVASAPSLSLTVDGLMDGQPVRLLVYAYDTDERGNPLNWSEAADVVATPRDSVAPGTPAGLTAQRDRAQLVVSFRGPGEDGAEGRPDRYEFRIAVSTDQLLDSAFESARALPAPTPVASGALFQAAIELPREFQSGELGFGVRAVDAAGNPGPASLVDLDETSSAPEILSLNPEIPLAGTELEVRGRGLGELGSARWVETSTIRAVRVTSWRSDRVVVTVPIDARAGELILTSAGAQTVSTRLGVLVRRSPSLSAGGPFLLLAATPDGEGRTRVRTVHRETGRSGTPRHSLGRYIDEALEPIEHVPLVETRSGVLAGDHRADTDVFAFVSGGGATELTTSVISSSTTAPNATRLVSGVAAGGIDGLSLMLLPGGTPDRVPALVAFTRAGILRAARVDNMRLDRFDGFNTYTSTRGYGGLVGARSAAGGALLGVFVGGPSELRLTLWTVPPNGDPGGLVPRSGERSSGPEAVIRALPSGAAPGGYLVAHSGPAGSSQIWLGLDRAFPGGLVPVLSSDQPLRLEDLGFVDTGDGLQVVVLASRLQSSGAELIWAEVPLSAVVAGSAPTQIRAVPIDLAPEVHRARLGCRRATRECWALWAHPQESQVLFVRR